MFHWLLWIIFGLLAFVIPGWGILSFFWDKWDEFIWIEKLSLAGGLSLTFYPLILLWTNVLNIHLGMFNAWIPVFLGIVLIVANHIKTRNFEILRSKQHFLSKENIQNEDFWLHLTTIIVVLLIILVRFWVIRNLDTPLWGDSYQHTMISQLLVDNNGLFQSWVPYAELQSFSYHFGFHSFVAVFHWISQITIIDATLITGQLLNVAAVIFLFPLTSYIAKNRWAGVISIFIAGLLSPMPMYFVNWGRYTQLAGLTILPVLTLFLWIFLDEAKDKAMAFMKKAHEAFQAETTWRKRANKELLADLEAGLTGLTGYRQPRHRVVFLHGIPGSGKSTLAQGILLSHPASPADCGSRAAGMDRCRGFGLESFKPKPGCLTALKREHG